MESLWGASVAVRKKRRRAHHGNNRVFVAHGVGCRHGVSHAETTLVRPDKGTRGQGPCLCI